MHSPEKESVPATLQRGAGLACKPKLKLTPLARMSMRIRAWLGWLPSGSDDLECLLREYSKEVFR